MSSEDKSNKNTAVETEKKEEEIPHYSRCSYCIHCNNPAHVGTLSTAQQLKLKWHQAHFDRTEFRTLPDGRHQHFWKPKKSNYPSLKQFARELASEGDALAKDWLDHKSGSLNEERSDKNKSRISLEKQATKSARKKKKAGGGKTTETAAPAPTTK